MMYYIKGFVPDKVEKKRFVKRMNDYRLNQYNNVCVGSRDHSKCHVLYTCYFFVT